MRKIEMDMCEALETGKTYKQTNTRVDKDGRVWLYSTCIARYHLNVLQLRTTGYAYCWSATTKSRLRALRYWGQQHDIEIIEE